MTFAIQTAGGSIPNDLSPPLPEGAKNDKGNNSNLESLTSLEKKTNELSQTLEALKISEECQMGITNAMEHLENNSNNSQLDNKIIAVTIKLLLNQLELEKKARENEVKALRLELDETNQKLANLENLHRRHIHIQQDNRAQNFLDPKTGQRIECHATSKPCYPTSKSEFPIKNDTR